MRTFDRERLLQLLPAIYRLRDEEGDGTLAALLGILAQQAEILGEDLQQLYDDQFIETCAEWVVPYIADLVGARGVVSVESAAFSARAYVANTIRYRRRKGTIAVIEQLARDVTGWPASAVEYFLKLITTTNVNHVRHDIDYELEHADHIKLKPFVTVDLRDVLSLERLHSPFEVAAHTADVRRIFTGRGRYNIPNVGIFLWRLKAYPLTASPAVKADDRHFFFHPLGINSPLITNPATETEIEHLAEPLNVPLPISRRALDAAVPSFYGTAESDHSFLLLDAGGAIDISQIHVCDLSDGSGGWEGAPAEPVAVDPVLGRIAFHDPPAGPVAATFHYAFPADIGGGEYEREASFELGDQNLIRVPDDFATITAALAAAAGKGNAVIEITDSGRYEETLSFQLDARQQLELRADNSRRPTIVLGGDCVVRGGERAQLFLNGLLIAGGALVVPRLNNKLARLQIEHCTLVPGQLLARDGSPLHPDRPSIVVEEPDGAMQLVLEASITGALHVSENATSVEAKDSIVDGGPPRLALAVLSAKHTNPIDLNEAAPAIDVTVGRHGPIEVTLDADQYTVAEARDALQKAIRDADPAFANVVVLSDQPSPGFLLVMSGTSEPIALEPHGADATLSQLKLDAPQRHIVRPFVSDRLPTGTITLQPNAAVRVRIGNDPAQDISLNSATVVGFRQQFSAAIPTAKALVMNADTRLVFVPTAEETDVVFAPAAADAVTIRQLGLTPAREAVRGVLPGTDAAALSLDACTIFGPVFTVALPLVTDSIFTERVIARRKQTGCVRFSFVPDGSQTPRKYRCQPELEIAEETARQRKKKFILTKAAVEAIRRRIIAWLVPGFVSTRYGDGPYAQLTRSTPAQIRTGSESGAEMGVYEMLRQPQREANLRAALDEYLRFGLEAGIFYAS